MARAGASSEAGAPMRIVAHSPTPTSARAGADADARAEFKRRELKILTERFGREEALKRSPLKGSKADDGSKPTSAAAGGEDGRDAFLFEVADYAVQGSDASAADMASLGLRSIKRGDVASKVQATRRASPWGAPSSKSIVAATPTLRRSTARRNSILGLSGPSTAPALPGRRDPLSARTGRGRTPSRRR